MSKLDIQSETIANASNIVRVQTILGDHEYSHKYAVTFRPCEHKIVTLNNIRKKYGSYTISQQREILQNCLYHLELKGLKCHDIFFEETDIATLNKRTVHFHAKIYFNELGTYYTLVEHTTLLNSRYGPKSYKAFDYEEEYIKPPEAYGHLTWLSYCAKDHKHELNDWTANK